MTHTNTRLALAALATLLVLGAIVILIPHAAYAQTTQLFGYGGGGRLPFPIAPRLGEFLQLLFSRIFGHGGFPF